MCVCLLRSIELFELYPSHLITSFHACNHVLPDDLLANLSFPSRGEIAAVS